MRPLSRREFLQGTSAAALLASASAMITPSARAAESAKKGEIADQLRVAVVGVRGRGMSHVGGFAGKNNCVITTVCDCDEGVISNAMKRIEKVQGQLPKYEKDFRRLLDDKNIDVISIATPNHWHALMAIWAMQNGKDVYVEKPVSHNVREGRLMVEAARKYNKMCQCGTQSRSNPGMRDSIAYIHAGKIGKVRLGYGLCYKNRPSIGKVDGPQEPPKTMDYNLWCGPAPLEAPRRNTKNGTVHYDWHWIWNYGNGDLGNQGIHEMDKARWGLGKNELPRSVISLGGRFGYIDDGETANTQISLFNYGDSDLIFEVRGLPSKPFKGAGVGNIWVGSEGMVVCPNYASGIVFNPAGEKVAEFKGGDDQYHFDNFAKAVRSRKVSDLNGDILEGHLSSALCHLGNISYRLGQSAPLDKNGLAEHKDAADAFARMADHLQENKVPLETTQYRLGRKLTIDPKTELFTNDKEAVPMLFREYRKPFVLQG